MSNEGSNAAKEFARWLEDGPQLAKAAGCYVGIKVTAAARELWQIPARELDDAELEQQYKFAAYKFDNRGEHGGSPGEYWAERMDEIDQERKHRSLSA